LRGVPAHSAVPAERQFPPRIIGDIETGNPMSESYVQLVTREFKRLQSLADGAMSQLSDEQFFTIPAPGDNSVAVIVKHVGGNLVSRWADFLTSDGEKPGRDREREFRIDPGDTREQLLQMWARGWTTLFAALAPLGDSDMARIITIRGEPLTVVQAVNRQLTHYAYHVGQIVYVAKHHRGSAWRPLSIPVGRSAEFNRNPARYVSNG
jgi:hypothetical protein